MDFHLNTHSQFVAKIFAALKNLPDSVSLAGSSLIVSISGGPDSTALLLALRILSETLPLKLQACHVNHGVRPGESELDERFCRDLCGWLDIPLHVVQQNNASPVSEESLRTFRYNALRNLGHCLDSNLVFLGHTSNDQVETVLFRVFRGTSPTGLAGMRAVHLLKNGLTLVRPMLTCSRDEVNEFLSECRVQARIDSSNQADKFARNFLRNQIIPLAETRFPALARQIERLRQVSADEDGYLSQISDRKLLELSQVDVNLWNLFEFDTIELPIQRRVLAKALAGRGVEVTFERVQAILNMMATVGGPQRISLDQTWDVLVSSRSLIWLDKRQSPSVQNHQAYEVRLPGTTMMLAFGAILNAEPCSDSLSVLPTRDALDVMVDLSRVNGALVVRERRPGDRIRPLGMTILVRLKKYMHSNNKLVPALGRLVLADQEEVLWVPGVGLSESVKVVDCPTHRLWISRIAPDVSTA